MSQSTPAADLAPHNWEAEEAVLGSILVDPDCLMDVMTVLKASDFYREKNAWIYESMVRVGEGVNQITVAQDLAISGKLEPVGGAGVLSRLVERVPTSVHATYYAQIVADTSYQRKLISVVSRMAKAAYSHKGDRQSLYAKAHELLNEVQPGGKTDLVGPQEHAEVMASNANRDRKAASVVHFGYGNLDTWTGGMHAGNLVIIGARPGAGKSQIEQEIATFNADRKRTVLVASAEMSLDEWDERQIAMECGMSISSQRSRRPNAREEKAIMALVARTAERPLHFLRGSLTVANIESQARYLAETSGLSLILVDYLQLLADTVSGDSIREKVGFISRSLKRLARDCECPCIVASQLNRKVEERGDKRPVLSDLKESGDIEQDADLVLLLHRPEMYEAGKEPGLCHVYIAKQRQGGKVGKVVLKWDDRASRYRDPKEVEVEQEEMGI